MWPWKLFRTSEYYKLKACGCCANLDVYTNTSWENSHIIVGWQAANYRPKWDDRILTTSSMVFEFVFQCFWARQPFIMIQVWQRIFLRSFRIPSEMRFPYLLVRKQESLLSARSSRSRTFCDFLIGEILRLWYSIREDVWWHSSNSSNSCFLPVASYNFINGEKAERALKAETGFFESVADSNGKPLHRIWA